MAMRDPRETARERAVREGILVNPASDRLFSLAASRAAATSGSERELEERLRRRDPLVRVRAQSSDGRGIPTWFIYRDGSWVNDGQRRLPGRVAIPVEAASAAGDGTPRPKRSGLPIGS